MNPVVRRLATVPFRILPSALRRRMVQAALYAAADRSPREALQELLTIETDLSGIIDQQSLAYGDGIHVKHRLMRYHDFFVERIGDRDRVVDIGCGYGAVANSIATRTKATVVGLDMDRDNVAAARARFTHERLTFVEGEAPRVLPDGPFDVVVMSNVLEHIEHRVEFLREVQRRIAPDRWLIRVPMFNRDWRPSLRKELGLFPFGDPTHFTEYTRESFETEMREAGLDISHLQVNWGEVWAVARGGGTPSRS
jgi:SAM-dependent methyltransferase